MSNDKQNTEELIASLSGDLVEVKVMPRPLSMAFSWSLLAVLYLVIALGVLGLRGDLGEKTGDPVYVFELLHVLAISLSAAYCSLWLCFPDMRGQRWMLAVPSALFAAFITWILLRLGMDDYHISSIHWSHCHRDSIVFGAIPAFTILFLSTRGKTTRPNMMAFMNILAVGGLGYLGLRISCASDDIGHLLSFHILPYLLFGILISMVGKRIFRW